jgi:hypothetical protein
MYLQDKHYLDDYYLEDQPYLQDPVSSLVLVRLGTLSCSRLCAFWFSIL